MDKLITKYQSLMNQGKVATVKVMIIKRHVVKYQSLMNQGKVATFREVPHNWR